MAWPCRERVCAQPQQAFLVSWLLLTDEAVAFAI